MILIPTQFERQILSPLLVNTRPLEVCGFGPVAAAALTSRLISQHSPSSIVLVGIAGTYDEQLPVGQAFVFDSVGCYGVGVGAGDTFQTANQLGWAQVSDPEITDSITLVPNERSRQLLTVCSAAASPEQVSQRRTVFPKAVAEDMEGFGVAMACALADIPLTIVRGISNIAGDRDKSHWQIHSALGSAAELTNTLLADC